MGGIGQKFRGCKQINLKKIKIKSLATIDFLRNTF